MKKIITPAVREEAEILCDATGKPAVAALVMYFWYGSAHDSCTLKADLSDEVAEEILQMLQAKYPQFQLEERQYVMHCPVCDRHF